LLRFTIKLDEVPALSFIKLTFVDEMIHVPTCDRLCDKFLALYQKDFEVTGGGIMEKLLGMEVEQSSNLKEIKLHLDIHV
jgi:hypothetical protein